MRYGRARIERSSASSVEKSDPACLNDAVAEDLSEAAVDVAAGFVEGMAGWAAGNKKLLEVLARRLVDLCRRAFRGMALGIAVVEGSHRNQAAVAKARNCPLAAHCRNSSFPCRLRAPAFLKVYSDTCSSDLEHHTGRHCRCYSAYLPTSDHSIAPR